MIKTSSPFLPYANATIELPRVSVGEGSDRYGNQIVLTEVITFQCLLEPAKADTFSTQFMPGVNTNLIFVSGYLVDPYQFPYDIGFPCDCDAEMKIGPGNTKRGKIRLLPTLTDPFLLESGYEYINRVKGWFYY